MDQVLRFNNTDQRIIYDDEWKVIPNSGAGQNGTHSYTSTRGATLFFLFRGMVRTQWPSRHFLSFSWYLIRVSLLRYKRQILWPYRWRWRKLSVPTRRQHYEYVLERRKF